MRTITTNLYTFDELSEEAKEKAIENWRSTSFPFIRQDEMIKNIKAIAKAIDCDYDYYSYDGINYEVYLMPTSFCQADLSGKRAWAYIENNFITPNAKAKIYYKDYVIYSDDRKNWKRKSKIWYTLDDYPFTGYCADCCFIEAWREWQKLFRNDNTLTVDDFIYLVANNLSKAWTSDNEYQNSDEAIAELLNINEYEFTEDGNRY